PLVFSFHPSHLLYPSDDCIAQCFLSSLSTFKTKSPIIFLIQISCLLFCDTTIMAIHLYILQMQYYNEESVLRPSTRSSFPKPPAQSPI
ncbi:hypothetical protein ES319_A03G177800v1, partial [Gossypium barbadense]